VFLADALTTTNGGNHRASRRDPFYVAWCGYQPTESFENHRLFWKSSAGWQCVQKL